VVVSSDHKPAARGAAPLSVEGRVCPVFVRDAEDVPKGNKETNQAGGIGLESEKLGRRELGGVFCTVIEEKQQGRRAGSLWLDALRWP